MEIKPVLRPYVAVADMLAKTFGQECEVVLHDLSIPERSVVYVANNSVTGRKVGQSFDQLVKQVILSSDLKEDFVAN
ncbi:MAG: PAS domain-containing protein, partial [Clostridia bacterium]|nr:PAS domain-containing protein [Clostridia bacterium]